MASKHHRANFAPANSAHFIQRDRECLRRIFQRWNVGKQSASVEVNRVTTDRLDDGNTGLIECFAQVRCRANAILEIVWVHTLVKALSNRLQVAPGQTTVGGKSLGEDE